MRLIRVLFICMLLGGGILGNALIAKEPTNWIFGFGMGAGKSQIEQKWSDSSRNKLEGLNVSWSNFAVMEDASEQDWGVAYEFLVGYKHWFNEWAGFRYYANVGVQHYKHKIFDSGNVKATIIDYTLNADLLLNFYNSEFFTFGVFGGFGVGGATFDSPAITNYERYWGAAKDSTSFTEPEYVGVGKIKKHHLSASLSVGTRFNIFQKIRHSSERSCSEVVDGRRTCRVPISYLEHSIEFSAKFPMLTYYPTEPGELMGVRGTDGKYTASRSRPGYEVVNPYRFTVRYIVAF